MLEILFERLRQKCRTVGFPDAPPSLPPRFRGRPVIDAELCAGARGISCARCRDACPVGAITLEGTAPALDMGVCTFCGDCARACAGLPKEAGARNAAGDPGESALMFTTDWRLGTTDRSALVQRPMRLLLETPGTGRVFGRQTGKSDGAAIPAEALAAGFQGTYRAVFVSELRDSDVIRQSFPETPAHDHPRLRVFRLPELPVAPHPETAFALSFRLRQVTAAGCGACEADLNVLTTVVFDLARFGMDFVASPRHADGLVLTGPLPRNMLEGFRKCDKAMPAPKALIAVGACAISGGLFRDLPEPPDMAGVSGLPKGPAKGRTGGQSANGVAPHHQADLFIPGCAPHPYTSLDALLRFIGREVPLL